MPNPSVGVVSYGRPHNRTSRLGAKLSGQILPMAFIFSYLTGFGWDGGGLALLKKENIKRTLCLTQRMTPHLQSRRGSHANKIMSTSPCVCYVNSCVNPYIHVIQPVEKYLSLERTMLSLNLLKYVSHCHLSNDNLIKLTKYYPINYFIYLLI